MASALTFNLPFKYILPSVLHRTVYSPLYSNWVMKRLTNANPINPENPASEAPRLSSELLSRKYVAAVRNKDTAEIAIPKQTKNNNAIRLCAVWQATKYLKEFRLQNSAVHRTKSVTYISSLQS